MRLALISLSAESSGGNAPVGMLPLFDSNVLSQQVQSVQQMGAEKIILLSPTIDGRLLQYADDLKSNDVKVDITRSAMDLQQYISPDDDLIFLGDGVFPDHSIVQKLRKQSGELIYVVANADNYENFERIDLSHRWLGIAVLKTDRLAEIAEIPDDWDIGSALLRTAVQAQCERELVSDVEMQADAVPQLLNSEDGAAYVKRQLSGIELPRQNFFDKFVTWPLMRKLMPFLWQSPSAKNYSGFASLGAATVGLMLALLGWPALSLSLLFAGSIALVLHHRISIFSVKNTRTDFVGLSFYLLAAIGLTVTVVQHAMPESLFGDVSILLLLCGNLWLASKLSDNHRVSSFMPDIPLILFILSIATGLGAFAIGLYFTTLICLAYLIVAQRDRSMQQSVDEPTE